MKVIINILSLLIEKINKNHIDEHAAGCAYYTILAFIPIIMLILTLTKYIGIEEEVLFFILNELIPSNILNNAIMEILMEVYSKSVGTITISAIFILWSAGKGFFALCKGLNAAYEIEEKNRFMMFRIKAIISTIIFIISIILTLLLLVFGNTINLILQEKFNIFSKIINFLLERKTLISIIGLSFVFTIMYRFIPKHKQRLKKQIPGAAIAAIACNIISVFYAVYIEIFTGFSLMYGSLTTIVLAMMWVYACMYSILLGATINKLISESVEKGNKIFTKNNNRV